MKIIIIVVVIAGLLMFAILSNANKNDQILLNQADCVVEEAKAQGYKGDPNSAEAWNLFINKCNN